MRRVLLVPVFCLALLAGPVWAQDVPPSNTPALSSLDLALWPEYDRPEVLVIYSGLLTPEASLPAPLEIWLPARIGRPSAVAWVDEGGQRYNQDYTTRVEGDRLVVSFELASRGFQLEYYDPLTVDSAGNRVYTYTHTVDYPTAALSLEVQQPPTAKQFTIDPPADSVETGADGLIYHRSQVGAVEQGEARTWTLSYEKPDSALTFETVAPQQPSTAETVSASETPPDAGSSPVLLFLVAFVVVLAVGTAAFWLGRHTLPIASEPPPPTRLSRARGGGEGENRGRTESGLFCHKCGTPLRADSDFCHKCGTPVRRR